MGFYSMRAVVQEGEAVMGKRDYREVWEGKRQEGKRRLGMAVVEGERKVRGRKQQMIFSRQQKGLSAEFAFMCSLHLIDRLTIEFAISKIMCYMYAS